MKTCFVDLEHRAIADLIAPGELTKYWTITRINVPAKYRNKGIGTSLLKQILTEADTEGLILTLEPSPSDGLDYEQLVSWYKKHGFKMTRIGYMKRLPNS